MVVMMVEMMVIVVMMRQPQQCKRGAHPPVQKQRSGFI